MLPAVALLAALAACGGEEPNTLRRGQSLGDAVEAVDAAFTEKYGHPAVAVAAEEVTRDYLAAYCGLSAADADRLEGRVSGNAFVCFDTLLAVEAAEGRADAVAEAFERRRADLAAQLELLNVSGAGALAGEVYRKGDYVFLLVVGPAPNGGAGAARDLAGDVAMAKAALDASFY